MQDEGEGKADYDELTMNPLMAEVEAGVAGEDSRNNKQRRYWTAKEEECFYEIWGRDNWRLTRHGKNTIFFAQWSDELKERHDIDVRPEEIQAKVNQTRAKFRSVKKQASNDKNGPRWKKFDIIDRILKNKYRPKDAEPIPPEILKKNRDISPEKDDEETTPNIQQPSTPTSLTSSSQDTNIAQQQQNTLLTSEQNELNTTLNEHDVTASLFNANELQPNPDYGNQLYNNIKQEEFQPEYHHQTPYPTQYTTDENDFTSNMADEPPQLLELQTPQQQMQQYNNVGTPAAYDHHSGNTNAAAAAAAAAVVAAAAASYTSPSADAVNLLNNQQHYNSATSVAAAPPAQQPYNAQQYPNNAYTPAVNNGNSNNGVMQPPRSTSQALMQVPRKRGRHPASHANHVGTGAASATASSDPSLELVYLDEVRKKNAILEEHKEIARKRLQIEERKIALMEQFFPKCLELQAKIMSKLQPNNADTSSNIQELQE